LTRKEQGPQEFSSEPLLFVSEKGYISAYESMGRYISIFSPDYKFIVKKNVHEDKRINNFLAQKYKEYQISIYSLNKIQCLSEKETIYYIYLLLSLKDNKEMRSIILYENSDTLKIVSDIKNYMYLFEGGYTYSSNRLGFISFEFNEKENKIIYCNSKENNYSKKEGLLYTIHINSLNDEIYRKYIRIIKPKEYPEIKNTIISSGLPKSFNKRIYNELNKVKYMNPVFYITNCEYYIFIHCNNTGEKSDFIDVFNLRTEKFTKRIWITEPFFAIRNNHAFSFGNDKEGYTVLNIYKVNPKFFELLK
jgi:hypothetical protein